MAEGRGSSREMMKNKKTYGGAMLGLFDEWQGQ